MRGVQGLAGWRWLFLIEGLLTLVIGIIAALLLPASASQTKGRLRGKVGWFNDTEEEILVNRLVREDPTKGMMHNRQPITWRMLWDSLKDYDLWYVLRGAKNGFDSDGRDRPMYLIIFLTPMPSSPPSQYFTIEMKKLGWSTTQTNLLTIPKSVLHSQSLLCSTHQFFCYSLLTLCSHLHAHHIIFFRVLRRTYLAPHHRPCLGNSILSIHGQDEFAQVESMDLLGLFNSAHRSPERGTTAAWLGL